MNDKVMWVVQAEIRIAAESANSAVRYADIALATMNLDFTLTNCSPDTLPMFDETTDPPPSSSENG